VSRAQDTSTETGWQVGIDIGGTFTDVIAAHPVSGEMRTGKVATRVGDRIAGLVAALEAVGLQWPQVDDLIHGTTMITNAIVENDLADVALVATAGFSDTLAIGRQNRSDLYRLDTPPKLPPQVPAEHRFEVGERLDHRGDVLQELDEQSVDAAIENIQSTGCSAVAVCLMHAYADARHERLLLKRLREEFPFVTISSQINPEAREYERMATTVLSASVMPLAAIYLDRLEAAKPEASRLHLFHSAGGMASPAALRDLPLGMAMSGPAAGVAAACSIAGARDIPSAMSFDMGGTTTDVCLITNGKAEISSNRSIAGRPMRQPMVAVESIGAGGGSIARLDHGALRVGPESAGAEPGPACYGRGGMAPTVSDANLVLGYLEAGRELGDGLRLDVDAARDAIRPLAEAMEMAVEEAALGIIRVANAAMIRALQRITVERGIDGRAATMLAFGGAGPMHAVDVARGFGISQILVPAGSSAFSAFGCLSAQMSYAQKRTVRMARTAWDLDRLAAVQGELHETLSAPLLETGAASGDLGSETVASIRYAGQSYAIEIDQPDFENPDDLGAAFFAKHQVLYGFHTDEPWELVAIRMRVFADRGSGLPSLSGEVESTAPAAQSAMATFKDIGSVKTPRIARDGLSVGREVTGPAIIEDSWSTIVLPPGATLVKSSDGHLDIQTGATP